MTCFLEDHKTKQLLKRKTLNCVFLLGERSPVFICWCLVEGSTLPLQEYASKVYLDECFLWLGVFLLLLLLFFWFLWFF